jgi:hypothetical protein
MRICRLLGALAIHHLHAGSVVACLAPPAPTASAHRKGALVRAALLAGSFGASGPLQRHEHWIG